MERNRLFAALHHANARLAFAWATMEGKDAPPPHQGIVLAHLLKNGPCLPSEIEKATGNDPSVELRAFQRMEHAGLITRTYRHRRQTEIRLTEKGREWARRVLEFYDASASVFWGDLPASDLEAAGRVLTQLQERSK